MPKEVPLISIVVPSFNQGHYLAETLGSLVAQHYPRLEIIIQDAGSTDSSVEIARNYVQRHPGMFRLFVEKDRGQAHGINLGLKKATGEILGFLNADDTLFPGCLHSVAREIDPLRKRYIVFGRCVFTGEDSPYTGIEHPATFVDHFHQLAIWRRGFNTIPQPSTFWHRVVYEKCGGLDENQQHVLDYELFCRFSKHFVFHKVDELWATYRIHSESKTFARNEQEVLEMSIAVSRKFWGPIWSPFHWRCRLSHWLHNPTVFEHARHHARRAEESFNDRRLGPMLRHLTATLLLSPRLGWNRLIYPFVMSRVAPLVQGAAFNISPEPRPRYADGWIGPNFVEPIQIPREATKLVLRLTYHRPKPMKTRFIVSLNDQERSRLEVSQNGNINIPVDVRDLAGQTPTLRIVSSPSFVPKNYVNSEDERVLSAMLGGIDFETRAG
jgi:glycosyltransferase involved in cell wall biosynthesis